MKPNFGGWGHYYHKAHVRRLFTQLDAWIVHLGASLQTVALQWLETVAAHLPISRH